MNLDAFLINIFKASIVCLTLVLLPFAAVFATPMFGSGVEGMGAASTNHCRGSTRRGVARCKQLPTGKQEWGLAGEERESDG